VLAAVLLLQLASTTGTSLVLYCVILKYRRTGSAGEW
jgi:hypothetical protein